VETAASDEKINKFFLQIVLWPSKIILVPATAYLVMGDTKQVADGTFPFPVVS
jgi:hypothetical protein